MISGCGVEEDEWTRAVRRETCGYNKQNKKQDDVVEIIGMVLTVHGAALPCNYRGCPGRRIGLN